MCSIIGTPRDDEWPREARVLPQSFSPRIARLWDVIVPGICPLGKDLLQKLLTFNPRERITAKEALQHQFFEGLTVPPVEFSESSSETSLTMSMNKSLNTSSPDDSGYTSMYSQ